MQLSTLITLIIAACILALGIFFLYRKKGLVVNRIFFLICLSAIVWMVSSSLSDSSSTEYWALFWARVPPLGSFFFGPTLYLFSFYFPLKNKKITPWRVFLIYFPSLIAVPFIFTKYNVVSVTIASWGTDFVPGPLYIYLLINILFFVTLTLINLIRTFKNIKYKKERTQIYFVISGIIMMVAVAIATNLLLPIFGYAQASVYGPLSTVFFLGFTSYAIARHKFLNLKVVATELFTFMIILASLGYIFLSQSAIDTIWRLLLFIVLSTTAILLIRSVLQEVQRREEMQELAKKLADANEKLRKLDQSKTEFISIASHQLRTPLAVAKGYISMILEGNMGKVNAKIKDALKKMNKSNEHLIHLVETLLNISRIETGRIDFTFEKKDITDFVKNIIDQFDVEINKHDAKIKLKLLNKIPKKIVFDSDKIGEVFVNLIDNAIKYGAGGDIEVTMENKEKVLEICVIDNGIGIKKDELDDIFMKFKRGVNASATEVRGSGLGLYICRKLIELHGGKIWAESKGPGKGSKFCIHLPKDPQKAVKASKNTQA